MNEAPEPGRKAAAAPSDPEKSHPKGGKRPADEVTDRCASLEQGALSKRTKSSSSSIEEKTVEAGKSTLGKDCLDTILAFLPVDHLVILRSLSKDTKTTVDEMVLQRAKRSSSLDLKLRHGRIDQGEKKERIRVQQGWTEALQDRESVINVVIQTENLIRIFDSAEVERARYCLRTTGKANNARGSRDSPPGRYEYMHEVEWNDALDVSTALKAITKYFRHAEDAHVVKRFIDVHCLEAEKEGRNVLLAKETAVSLLLTNASNTVSFSKIVSKASLEKQERNFCFDSLCRSEERSTVLVFRLDNEMEIFLNSYFFQDTSQFRYDR